MRRSCEARRHGILARHSSNATFGHQEAYFNRTFTHFLLANWAAVARFGISSILACEDPSPINDAPFAEPCTWAPRLDIIRGKGGSRASSKEPSAAA